MSPTPYQQQAELDFDEPFWELYAEKIRKNNSSTPHQEQADLDFYEPFSESLGEKSRKNNSSTPPSGTGGLGFLQIFCTFWFLEIQLRLFLIGGDPPDP